MTKELLFKNAVAVLISGVTLSDGEGVDMEDIPRILRGIADDYEKEWEERRPL